MLGRGAERAKGAEALKVWAEGANVNELLVGKEVRLRARSARVARKGALRSRTTAVGTFVAKYSIVSSTSSASGALSRNRGFNFLGLQKSNTTGTKGR